VKFWNKLMLFWRAQDGLATVQWVALSGAVVVGVIFVAWILMNGLRAPATSISSSMTACTPQGCN